MAETGVIVMVALLTLRTQALLSSTIQGAGHMRGDKSGRYGNNGVADQDKNGGQDATQRRVRRDVSVADGGDGHDGPIDRGVKRGKAVFRPSIRYINEPKITITMAINE